MGVLVAGRVERKKIVEIDASQSGTVAAGDSEVITITPPVGKAYKIVKWVFEVSAVSGATSGTQKLRVYLKSSVTNLYRIAYTSAAYNSPIQVYNNLDVQLAVIDTLITSDIPLLVAYFNDTDAAQSGSRLLSILFEVFDEG